MDDKDQKPQNQPGQGVVPTPANPVGAFQKEQEPVLTEPLESQGEHATANELAEIGAKEASQAPQPIQEHTEVGIRVSQSTPEPVITSTPVGFKSPLTQAEMVTAKRSRITDAIAWLAGTIARQIKRSKFKERESLPKPI